MENLRQAIIEEKQKELKEKIEKIKTCDDTLKNYLTNLKNNQLKNGEITKEKATELAIKKATSLNKKALEKALYEIDEIEKADEFNEIIITIDYSRGSMGAYQGRAILTDSRRRIIGNKTTGFGYDKTSTAMASVLNQYYPLMKMLYQYRDNHINTTLRNIFGYGSGYGLLPKFEGGVGVESFYKIFDTIGLELKCITSGNKYDAYTVTLKNN